MSSWNARRTESIRIYFKTLINVSDEENFTDFHNIHGSHCPKRQDSINSMHISFWHFAQSLKQLTAIIK